MTTLVSTEAAPLTLKDQISPAERLQNLKIKNMVSRNGVSQIQKTFLKPYVVRNNNLNLRISDSNTSTQHPVSVERESNSKTNMANKRSIEKLIAEVSNRYLATLEAETNELLPTKKKPNQRSKMYGLETHDVEAMALASVHHNILGVPKTSILPEIIKISATDQAVLTTMDGRQKHNLMNSYNKILKNKKYAGMFSDQKVDMNAPIEDKRLSGIPTMLEPLGSRSGTINWQTKSKKAI